MRVVSGIQTTGNFHPGNDPGAIRQRVAIQDEVECLFFSRRSACADRLDLPAGTGGFDH